MNQLALPVVVWHGWKFAPTKGSRAARNAVFGESQIVCVWGAEGCGKSLLADEFGDYFESVFEDVDRLRPEDEGRVFDELQKALTLGAKRVLATSRWPVAQCEHLRADIKSRLLLGEQVELMGPAEDELPEIVEAWATARQVKLAPAVVKYILARAGRSAGELAALMTRLDGVSLLHQRPLTVPLVREVLGEQIT